MPNLIWASPDSEKVQGLRGDVARRCNYENSQLIKNALQREVQFYRNATSGDLFSSPECYFAEIDIGTGQGIVVLEDLVATGVRFIDPLVGLTPTQAGEVVDVLARLHAHTWGATSLHWLGERGGSLKADSVGMRLMSEESWSAAMARPRSAGLRGPLRDRTRVFDAMRRAYRANYFDTIECLLHGDPHPGNMFLRPSFDDAWTAYRREVIQPLLWVATPEGTQSEEIIQVISTRVSAAIEDLETFAALDLSLPTRCSAGSPAPSTS